MRLSAALALSAAVVGGLAAADARAVGTRTFELDTLDKLSGGDLKGVSVSSDGTVRAGFTLGDVPLPVGSGTTATCAVALADGSVLVGTGPASGGKVVRIANGQASLFADTRESAVSALAVDRAGHVFAATTSSRIYQVTQGKAALYATLPGVGGVFALAIDRAGAALYAATGEDGEVVRIEPGGTSSVYFKSGAPFIVSLAVASDGAVYAGTSGKSLLYRITAPGRATVVYDFHARDVHAIALGPSGVVYAIANEEATSTSSETSEASAPHSASGRSAPGPAKATHTKPGKGSLWRFDARGRPERMMHNDDFHYVSLALDDRGTPYVGTGAEGRVYTVDDAHVVTLMADTDERQIGALGVSGRTRFVLGSDPAVFHPISSVGGPGSMWTSKPLDAGLRARYGRITWRSRGTTRVSTRSGDTEIPDATWSPWSAPIASAGPIPSPAGRFVQVRAGLLGENATLSDVVVPFVTENLRAIVTEVDAQQRGLAPGLDSKEGVQPSGGELPKHDSVVHITWKVDNPDSDELRYRVAFRREGQTRWLDATRPDDVLEKTEFDWDTASLPEGIYRVRVDASDERANPLDDITRDALESAPVLVDNAPPVFPSLAMSGRRLRAEVVDGLGPIARVEVAIDGRLDWHPLAPRDGIFDSAAEAIDADITPLLPAGPGPHIVAIRAFDAAGNAVVAQIQAP